MAILSASGGPMGEGGWTGVGFAIPSNIVQHVMASLIKTGKVERGYLGVTTLEDLTPALARQFHVPDVSGALVNNVEPGSPADKAGLKQGDVIRTFEGQTVNSRAHLQSTVVNKSPGMTVTLGLLRDGKPMDLKVTLTERPSNAGERGGARPHSEGTLRGVSVQELTPEVREQLGLPSHIQGVVITEMDPDSPAAEAGLQPGDVVQSINRRPVNSVSDFNSLAAEARGETLLRINRGGNAWFVAVTPGGEE